MRKNIILINNSLIKHKLAIIRDKKCKIKIFRETINEITMLMCYKIFENIKLYDVIIETPICKIKQRKILNKIVIISILRAGLGMLDGMLKIVPNSLVGHIGVFRNKLTLKPCKYFVKLPKNIKNLEFIIIDPILATGGSAIMAVDLLKKKGINNIKFVSIISSIFGIEKLSKKYNDICIYTSVIDKKLNKFGYIVPGIGDTGDRLFGV